MLNFNDARLRALARRETDVWQAAVRRMPAWTRVKSAVMRPEFALCVGVQSGVEMVDSGDSGKIDRERLVEVVVGKALSAESGGFLPGRVEVGSEEDAAILRPLLDELGVPVEVKPVLQTVEAMILDLECHLQGRETRPIAGLLSVPGMTVERVRAFAEAAAAFYKAKPWKWSRGEPLLRVDPAGPDPALAFCNAMGAAGVCEGLSFLTGPGQVEQMGLAPEEFWKNNKGRYWSVMFDGLTAIPFADADLWMDHGLPVAAKTGYPIPVGTLRPTDTARPSPEALTHMEGVLRAFAAGSRKDLEAGGWEREVVTFDGARPVRLTLVSEPPAPACMAPVVVDREAILEMARQMGIDLRALAGATASRMARGRTGARGGVDRGSGGSLPAGSAVQLKITLEGSKPAIWRRVLVRSDATFATLHRVIQEAFGWTDSHLHQFEADGMRMALASPYGGDDLRERGARDSRKVRLGEVVSGVVPGRKQMLSYMYDFGDGWEHEIVVEKVVGAEEAAGEFERASGGAGGKEDGKRGGKGKKARKPALALCQGGARRCPPEDCGGMPGYEEMLEIIEDPGHEEYEDRREWLGLAKGETWEAERFDVVEVNRALGRIR